MILPVYNAFHPILRQKTKEVKNLDGSILKLIDDMFETMSFADGIGLAANQVGKNISILIVGDIYIDNRLIHSKNVYINPEILDYSDETEFFNEGCLSIPEFKDDVERPKSIQVRYFDLDQHECNEEIDGIVARVLQHEIDHLNGILFFDRLKPIRRTLAHNKLSKIRKGLILPNYPMILPNGQLSEPNKNKMKS